MKGRARFFFRTPISFANWIFIVLSAEIHSGSLENFILRPELLILWRSQEYGESPQKKNRCHLCFQIRNLFFFSSPPPPFFLSIIKLVSLSLSLRYCLSSVAYASDKKSSLCTCLVLSMLPRVVANPERLANSECLKVRCLFRNNATINIGSARMGHFC